MQEDNIEIEFKNYMFWLSECKVVSAVKVHVEFLSSTAVVICFVPQLFYPRKVSPQESKE